MDRKQKITVIIEGIPLPMTVSSTEEEKIYRDAAALIQNKLRSFRDKYPSLPNDKYYYAMTMLYTAVESVSASQKADPAPFFEMMSDLEVELDKVIKK